MLEIDYPTKEEYKDAYKTSKEINNIYSIIILLESIIIMSLVYIIFK